MKILTFSLLLFFLSCGISDTLNLLSLDEIIRMARINNLALQAAKAKYEAAKQRTAPFRYLMDPQLGIEFAGNGRMYSLTQEFPLPTKISSNLKLAKLEASQAFQNYKRKEQEIVAQAKRLYAQILLQQRKIELMKRVKERLDQILKVTLRNYALGRSQQSDVLSTKIEIEKINSGLLATEDMKNSLLIELGVLLNLPDSLVTGVKAIVIKDTTFDLEELYQIAAKQNLELKLSQTEIKKIKTALSLAKQDYLPDLMFKFEQEERDFKFSDRKFMVGLTLAVWFWVKQRKMVAEMAAEVIMAEAEYEAMENKIRAMVRESKINLDKHRREINLYQQTILPLAEANFESSLKAYEVGKGDFVTVLTNVRMLLESEMALYQTQADYLIALAESELAVGLELSNKKGAK